MGGRGWCGGMLNSGFKLCACFEIMILIVVNSILDNSLWASFLCSCNAYPRIF